MPSSTKRDGKHRGLVRLRGFPAESKTFETKRAALAWAREREEELKRSKIGSPDLRLDKLIDRYVREVALVSGHTSWKTLARYTHLKPASLIQREEFLRGLGKKAGGQTRSRKKKPARVSQDTKAPHPPGEQHGAGPL